MHCLIHVVLSKAGLRPETARARRIASIPIGRHQAPTLKIFIQFID